MLIDKYDLEFSGPEVGSLPRIPTPLGADDYTHRWMGSSVADGSMTVWRDVVGSVPLTGSGVASGGVVTLNGASLSASVGYWSFAARARVNSATGNHPVLSGTSGNPYVLRSSDRTTVNYAPGGGYPAIGQLLASFVTIVVSSAPGEPVVVKVGSAAPVTGVAGVAFADLKLGTNPASALFGNVSFTDVVLWSRRLDSAEVLSVVAGLS